MAKKVQEKAEKTVKFEEVAFDNTDIKTIGGQFIAWSRTRKGKNGEAVACFKCVMPNSVNGERIDVTAWISERQAERFGIENGVPFVGKFAYEKTYVAQEARTVSGREFPREIGLYNASLVSVE